MLSERRGVEAGEPLGTPEFREIRDLLQKAEARLRADFQAVHGALRAVRADALKAPPPALEAIDRARRGVLDVRRSVERVRAESADDREAKRLALAMLDAGARGLVSFRSFVVADAARSARFLRGAKAAFAEMSRLVDRLARLIGKV